MIISTEATEGSPAGGDRIRKAPGPSRGALSAIQTTNICSRALSVLAGFALVLATAEAAPVLAPWIPIFKGVDHAVGTNTPGDGGFDRLQVVHAIRVALTDPDVQLFTSPPMTNYVANSRETAGLTVMDFVTTHKLQVAINVNFFDPQQYYLPAGTPMNAYGLLVSRGTVVSEQDGPDHSSTLWFNANNEAAIVPTNWPPISNEGIYSAVSGEYPILIAGENIGFQYLGNRATIHGIQPRTALGLSRDRRALYLLTIDGRQRGYSEGALDWETAEWMIQMGAYDAVNMDGGGSTTLVMADSTGKAVELNRPSAVADSGRERTVGAHFGIYAKPVPGYINDITAIPDDTTATITWTTVEPATGQVGYGITADLGSLSDLESTPSTDHSAVLTGLSPDTTYYFAVTAAAGTNVYQSQTFIFTTISYLTTNLVFDVTNSWRYTTANLDAVSWASPGYDDSAWAGPGSGLLWIENREGGPNPEVQPKGHELPGNPDNNGFPYITYYFRTHFSLPGWTPGSSLRIASYVDDGAVFYLNGHEINRLNMIPAPEPVLNGSLATQYNCDGDATCLRDFVVAGDLATNVVAGDNVVAVEVHNYNLLSADITFGMTLLHLEPFNPSPQLTIQSSNQSVTLSWLGAGFTLQQADAPTGPWADVPGPVVTSPFTAPIADAARYFRLRK